MSPLTCIQTSMESIRRRKFQSRDYFYVVLRLTTLPHTLIYVDSRKLKI